MTQTTHRANMGQCDSQMALKDLVNALPAADQSLAKAAGEFCSVTYKTQFLEDLRISAYPERNAKGGTRTPTRLPPLPPQGSASTSSATFANRSEKVPLAGKKRQGL